MIKYALQCDRAHGFDSWFSSGADFDVLARRGLVECPVCGSIKVAKQLMAPAVATRARDPRQDDASSPGPSVQAPTPVPTPVPAPAAAPQMVMAPEAMQEMQAFIRAFRQHVMANTEDVGADFAEEARKIHYGETDERAIRGAASLDEARELHDEGITVMPIPVLPEDRN
jgi:hypothetical protein